MIARCLRANQSTKSIFNITQTYRVRREVVHIGSGLSLVF